MSVPDNRTYWSGNLDARNLGGQVEFYRELEFAMPPDWEWATADALNPATSSSLQDLGPMLDLGAGLGVQSARFAQAGWMVIAADIALPRLRALQDNIRASVGPQTQVWPVLCRAEALPFQRGSLGGLATRSVLIHTDLATTARELSRCLAHGASVSIAEPLTSNPLVNLYRRTLAPKEWQSITRYFQTNGTEAEILETHFGPLKQRRWYLFGFLAFGFPFALRSPALWRLSLSTLGFVDSLIRRVAPQTFDRRAWFVTLRGSRTKPSSGVYPQSPQ